MIKNELGRSLVETVGMLAIMGVLSVVGISAYNSALNRNRANTLINEAQKRAILVMPQILLMGNTSPTLNEFTNNQFGYGTFDTVVYTKSNLNAMPENAFGIKVSNVPKKVCQNILNTIGDKTPICRLSSEETPALPITECRDDNTFLMIYNDDISGGNENPPQACSSHSDCGECGTCQFADGEETGVCVGECESACSTPDECGENDCVVCDSETKTCQNKCVEVEYLKSTGTQYIDTGVLSKNTETKIDFSFVSLRNEQSIMGMWEIERLIYQVALYQNRWYYGSNSANEINVAWIEGTPNTDRHTITLDGQGGLYQDGTLISTGPVSSVDSHLPIYIFGRNTSSAGGLQLRTASLIKCYRVQMKTNGTLVRDFTPVLSPTEEPCMFDKVSKKLFCNAGSGTFDYGSK